ncbi:translation factor GUF1 homolog, mitochondrial isoform X2 [Thrips palmi]|uniref:Translation factor GUF1 homolog, mitochondrial n=1 Tax=Thrips palmi TaxID=161013 RepID=A0A6P9AA02_THRPL|nr:translation factor GUF1 homolog, mitochondrial isoform X2 [Thrips palmi]
MIRQFSKISQGVRTLKFQQTNPISSWNGLCYHPIQHCEIPHLRFFSHDGPHYSKSDDPNEVPLSDIPVSHIRNFCIIAHVDHGKSTLADRLLEFTGAWSPSEHQGQPGAGKTQQVLDKLQVEQERGITVKAQTASLRYTHNNEEFLLNLIDTPGHVDFSNEVSRSLAVCQGVILLVDANEGVQAQTVANFYLAFTRELAVIPVLNKCDLKAADPEWAAGQLENLFDIDPKTVLKISAKTGMGVDDVLTAIVERIPPPQVDREAPCRALVFDGWFDRFRGFLTMLYVVDGSLKVNDEIYLTLPGELDDKLKKKYIVKGLGLLQPMEEKTDLLNAGQVGFMFCNVRSASEATLGSTVHRCKDAVTPLTAFPPAHPMVYAGLYPIDQSQFQALRIALDKLLINDSGVTMETETSAALGTGFRLGFLGLLHMEVFSQRLAQEFGTETIATAPSVRYKMKIFGEKSIKKYGGDTIVVSNAADMPDGGIIKEMFEPVVNATIITPDSYIGPIVKLCCERRGRESSSPTSIDSKRVMLRYILPLNEVVMDFHDTLKSLSSGYASFDYEEHGYEPTMLSKVDILLNGIPVQELSVIVHDSKVREEGRRLVEKLCEIIPREQFPIAVQSYTRGKIIARGNIKPYRKDVTAKLYGGDVTRRRKLLARQKEGKERLKMVANIGLPRDTFIKLLKK